MLPTKIWDVGGMPYQLRSDNQVSGRWGDVLFYLVFIQKLREDVKRDGAGLSRSLSCGPATGTTENACFRGGISFVGVVRRPITRGIGKVPLRPQPTLSGWKLFS